MLLASDLKREGGMVVFLNPKTVTSQTKKQLLAGLPSRHSPCGEGDGGQTREARTQKWEPGSLQEVSGEPGGGGIPLLPWNNCGQSPRGNLGSSLHRTTGHSS